MTRVLDDGDRVHVESGFKWFTICEQSFDPDDVDREWWHYRRGDDVTVCDECDQLDRQGITERL